MKEDVKEKNSPNLATREFFWQPAPPEWFTWFSTEQERCCRAAYGNAVSSIYLILPSSLRLATSVLSVTRGRW